MRNLTDAEQKEIFRRNIQRYMAMRGVTQADLAAKLELTQSTVSDWCLGKKYPRPRNMQQIADALGCLMSDLREAEKPRTMVPVLGTIRAGLPMDAVENIFDYEEISEAMARDGEYFALQIRGDSMEPRMRTGDVIIVRKQEQVDNGDVAVVLINGDEATVKRYYRRESGVSLVAINPAYEPLFYTPEQVEELPVRVMGKVVELRAKF